MNKLVLILTMFFSGVALATGPNGSTPVECKLDICKSTEVLNVQVNKYSPQVSKVKVQGNRIDGDIKLESTAIGNNLSIEMNADIDVKNDDMVVLNGQINKKSGQVSTVVMSNNRINAEVVEIDSTAVGNNASVSGQDRTIVSSGQLNVHSGQLSKVTVTRNNAVRRDPVINSTAIGNNLTVTGSVVKLGTAQGNIGSPQKSKVLYRNNNLGPTSISSTAVGNNVGVSVQ